jgi:SAM-dependent methyltransferase
MQLIDLIWRDPAPIPWSEGEKIPWDDPAFSERMLAWHLSASTDAASRRPETIDAQVAWIHHEHLQDQPARILDLGCGPGLYTQRLAAIGHDVTGIDFAPASISYAREQSDASGFPARYIQGDIRTAEYGEDFDLVLLTYGEFNVFRPHDAGLILRKALAALVTGGRIILEPQTLEAVRRSGQATPHWTTYPQGLFSAHPHLLLTEAFWDADLLVATERYYVVETGEAPIRRYASSTQAYNHFHVRMMLREAGFSDIEFIPSLRGIEDPTQRDTFVLRARKAG